MIADLRLAARRLLATPAFTVFAVLSLAVGVGVTTAVYSAVDAIFLKDLGIHDPGRVVFVVAPGDGRWLRGSISLPDFIDLRAAQKSFSSLSAAASFHAAVVSPSTTELVTAEAVDGGYFSTLGVTAVIGRAIRPLDETGGARVVVLSHGLWRARSSASDDERAMVAGHPAGAQRHGARACGGVVADLAAGVRARAGAAAHALARLDGRAGGGRWRSAPTWRST